MTLAPESDEALQGSLRDFPLPAVLRSLAGAGRTGLLKLNGTDDIWMADGRIYLASSPNAASISTILCSAGVGSVGYVEGLAPARGDNSPSLLTALLTDQPQLARRVARTLYEHNLDAIFELLIPSDVGFYFHPGRRHFLGDELSHDTEALVERAQQRLDLWRDIAEHVPSTSAVFRLRRHLPTTSATYEVSAGDWRYVTLIDGRRSVAELVAETGDSAFQVCSTLYRLLLEQIIVEVQPATHPKHLT